MVAGGLHSPIPFIFQRDEQTDEQPYIIVIFVKSIENVDFYEIGYLQHRMM